MGFNYRLDLELKYENEIVLILVIDRYRNKILN